jgi:hypothetical protein
VESHTLVGEFDVLETRPRLTSQLEPVGEVPQLAVEVLQLWHRASAEVCGLLDGHQLLGRWLDHFAGASVAQLGTAVGAQDEEEGACENGAGAGEAG